MTGEYDDDRGWIDAELADLGTEDSSSDEAPDAGPLPVLAVVGRPNVGKSTLVNRIIGRREAVVEDVPGVTRDRVTYEATWRGRRFTVVDTGGWDPDATGMALRIAEQAQIAAELADVILFVVDATVGVTDSDEIVGHVLRGSGKPVILAANKVDNQQMELEAAALWSLGLGEPQPVSALHGRSSGDLLDVVLDKLPETPPQRFGAERGPRRVALLGKPNVGKSSLLNKLLGEERVLVDPMAAPPATRWTSWSNSAGRPGASWTPRASAAVTASSRAPTSTPACAPGERWSAPRWRSSSSTPARC
nr:hypothetical protein GCM10020093_000050 [Planobispora longispora]